MKLTQDWMIVQEIQKDFIIDGLLQKYDDSDPIMLVKVLQANSLVESDITSITGTLENAILLINRCNKTAWHGNYLAKGENIIAIMTKDELNQL